MFYWTFQNWNIIEKRNPTEAQANGAELANYFLQIYAVLFLSKFVKAICDIFGRIAEILRKFYNHVSCPKPALKHFFVL